jgi:hypothetical protein
MIPNAPPSIWDILERLPVGFEVVPSFNYHTGEAGPYYIFEWWWGLRPDVRVYPPYSPYPPVYVPRTPSEPYYRSPLQPRTPSEPYYRSPLQPR